MEEDYKKWLTQFRKGFIELCILINLDKHKKLNGSALLKILKDVDLVIKEGTLYPLLNRMEQNELLVSQWIMPTNNGHPKKEYSMTEKGKSLLPEIIKSYEEHTNSINKLKD